jgi:MraZ protein
VGFALLLYLCHLDLIPLYFLSSLVTKLVVKRTIEELRLFRGRFEHSFDEKGRIAVPAKFRDLLTDSTSDGTVIVTNFDQCLAGYSLKHWEELEKRIAALPQFDPVVVNFLRYFVSGATECQLDKAGRILIPANLRASAGIDKDCMIVGQLTKFEVWATDRWNPMFGELSQQFVDITKAVGRLGVQL